MSVIIRTAFTTYYYTKCSCISGQSDRCSLGVGETKNKNSSNVTIEKEKKLETVYVYLLCAAKNDHRGVWGDRSVDECRNERKNERASERTCVCRAPREKKNNFSGPVRYSGRERERGFARPRSITTNKNTCFAVSCVRQQELLLSLPRHHRCHRRRRRRRRFALRPIRAHVKKLPPGGSRVPQKRITHEDTSALRGKHGYIHGYAAVVASPLRNCLG